MSNFKLSLTEITLPTTCTWSWDSGCWDLNFYVNKAEVFVLNYGAPTSPKFWIKSCREGNYNLLHFARFLLPEPW